MPVQIGNSIQTTEVGINFSQDIQTWIIMSGSVVSSEDNDGIDMIYDNNKLYNSGVIFSQNYYGIYSAGDHNSIINTQIGVIGGSYGILSYGYAVDILNDGIVEADNTAIYISGNYARVTNNGTIFGDYGIGLYGSFSQCVIVNTGSISASYQGIWTNGEDLIPTGTIFITNSGSISAPDAISTNHKTSLTNTGMIDGYIYLSDTDDYVRNKGFINGNTYLDTGDDFFDGRGGSSEGWFVWGETGKDTLLGGATDDLFYGGDDADLLKGNFGDDTLYGDQGADILIGGRGSDLFVLNGKTDSGVTAKTRDVIKDFSSSEGDIISLTQIDANAATGGNQAFVFIGTAAFSGAAGELRYELTGSGDVIVYGNIDNNLVADFSILLSNVSSLTATDFLL